MAYTVLARRYRSTTFDEVVGQSHVAQTLKRAIASGRIAHAYLLCGTRGTGKTSMARILAKALNCHSTPGPTPEPCGKCSSCVGIARGDDIDYIEIDAASNTQVEKTREAIIENVQYRPAVSRFKIFLIDEVHMLSKGSFNALLKTLEEPPEHVKFILATTEPEKILPTILSRCQRYDFRNIPPREVVGHLKKIVTAEGMEADEDALLMVARAGAGSMRDSLSLLDRLLSVGEKRLTLAAIENLLGLPPAERVATLVDAVGNGDAGGVLRSADDILASGMSPDSLVGGLIEHLHNLLLIRVCGNKTDLVEVPGVSRERLNEQASKIDAVLLTQDIAVLEELRRQLRSGAGGRALMDATLVRLALAEQFRSITELMGDGPALVGDGSDQKKKLAEPVATPQPRTVILPSPPPPPPPPVTSTPLIAGPKATLVPVPAEEERDELPAVGKVWEDTGGPSLKELLAAEKRKQAAAEANVEPVDKAELDAVWQRVLGTLRKEPGIFATLQGAKLISIGDGLATVSFPSDQAAFAKMIQGDAKREKVAGVLSEAIGSPVGVKVQVESAPVEATKAAAAPEPKRPTRPSLQEAMAMAAEQPAAAITPVAAGPQGVQITDALIEELKADELVKAVVDGLGGKIVRVVEE